MKRFAYILFLLFPLSILSPAESKAQGLAVSVDYLLDNLEFARSGDNPVQSMTYHWVKFTPSYAYKFAASPNLDCTAVIGVDFVKDMGSGSTSLLNEIPLYVAADRYYSGSLLSSYFGVFPRRVLEGEYSDLIMSRYYQENDFNLEGMLFKYRASSFYTETYLDWMGMFGQETRERFQIASYGNWEPSDWFSMGWTGSFYHYSHSVNVLGAVDNHVIQPFVKFDFSGRNYLDEASVRLSGYFGYQNLRMQKTLETPLGVELQIRLRYRTLTLTETASYSDNFTPFYLMKDQSGAFYGAGLYLGSRFYDGPYNKLELVWTPINTRYISGEVGARFHHSGKLGYLGTEQRITLRVNLGY